MPEVSADDRFGGQPTLAGTRGNGRNAPKPAIHGKRKVGTEAKGLRQLGEQRLRFLQIGGIDPLGEPVVDGCQQLPRLFTPPVVVPKPREARRVAQEAVIRAGPVDTPAPRSPQLVE
jgi:hypothetical protein